MEESVDYIWRKSSHSDGGNGDCVEVASAFDNMLVRDSKLADTSPILQFSALSWHVFTSAVKAG